MSWLEPTTMDETQALQRARVSARRRDDILEI